MTSEGERQCSTCGKPESDVGLFNIIMPPLIKERTDLCKPCLVIAIDHSRKKVSESQEND
jgi:hypothetical protein